MKKFLSVDRIEGDFAICIDENSNSCKIKTDKLVFDIREGQILYFDGEKYFLDKNEEKKRKKLASDLTAQLFKNKN